MKRGRTCSSVHLLVYSAAAHTKYDTVTVHLSYVFRHSSLEYRYTPPIHRLSETTKKLANENLMAEVCNNVGIVVYTANAIPIK